MNRMAFSLEHMCSPAASFPQTQMNLSPAEFRFASAKISLIHGFNPFCHSILQCFHSPIPPNIGVSEIWRMGGNPITLVVCVLCYVPYSEKVSLPQDFFLFFLWPFLAFANRKEQEIEAKKIKTELSPPPYFLSPLCAIGRAGIESQNFGSLLLAMQAPSYHYSRVAENQNGGVLSS